MNKKLILSLGAGVVLVAIAASPLAIKPNVDRHLADLQTQFNSVPGRTLDIQPVDENWFSTTYTVMIKADVAKLSPDLAESFGHTVELPFTMTTSYGPVFLSNALGVGLVAVNAQFDGNDLPDNVEWNKDNPLYQLTMTHGLLGTTAFTDNVESFKIVHPALDQVVTFSGYRGQGSMSPSAFEYEGLLNNLTINGEQNLSLSDYSITLDAEGSIEQILNNDLISYSLESELDHLEIKDVITLDKAKIAIENSINESDNVANGRLQISLNELDSPVLDRVNDINAELALNNFNLEFLKRYQVFIQDLFNTPQHQYNSRMSQFLMENAALITQSSPELNIENVRASFDSGQFEFSAHSRLASDDELNQSLQNPILILIQTLQADASFEADKALVKSISKKYLSAELKPRLAHGYLTQEEFEQKSEQLSDAFINTLIAQGLLQNDGDEFVSNFEMANGQATLNGQQIPL